MRSNLNIPLLEIPAPPPLDGPPRERGDRVVSVAVEHVCVTFGQTTAVDDVSLEIYEREVLYLLGPSGSGKSTLLRVIAGLTAPTRGRVVIDGVEVDGASGSMEPEKRRVGMVFQDHALFPHLTVARNVAFGLRGKTRHETTRIVRGLLDRVDLARHADRYPHELSGGERQRVALARALAPNPRVVLMDEPFSGLDERLRDRVRRDTLALLRETGTTAVVVTHSPREAASGDRIALLRRGRLLQCGSGQELYSHPQTPFAARFFGEINEFGGVCAGGRVDTPLGSFAAPRSADGARLRVCIRPEHLRVARAETSLKARALGVEFEGEVHRVTLHVEGAGTPVLIRTFGRPPIINGHLVNLELDPSHVIVVPDDES